MLDFSDRTRTGISKLISRCALNYSDLLYTYSYIPLRTCERLHFAVNRGKSVFGLTCQILKRDSENFISFTILCIFLLQRLFQVSGRLYKGCMYVCLTVALCDCIHGKRQHQLGQGERSFKEVPFSRPCEQTWLATHYWLSCSQLCSRTLRLVRETMKR